MKSWTIQLPLTWILDVFIWIKWTSVYDSYFLKKQMKIWLKLLSEVFKSPESLISPKSIKFFYMLTFQSINFLFYSFILLRFKVFKEILDDDLQAAAT